MNIHRIISILLLAVFLSAFVPNGDDPLIPHETEEYQLQPIGDVIEISKYGRLYIDSAAYSDKTKQYLVVYGKDTNNDDVYGRFVDAATGELTGDEFEIAGTSASEGPADVVYDPYNDVFLVVYMSGGCGTGECRFLIKGRLVNEPILNGSSLAESPLNPNEFIVADQDYSDFTLFNPRVAYNSLDHQFLVVFERYRVGELGAYSIYGRMLSSNKEQPVGLGLDYGFRVASFSPDEFVFNPDVSWASERGNFLVVFSGTDDIDPDLAEFSKIYAYWLYETYQDGADQVFSAYKIAPHGPLSKFCRRPSVAYDPTSDTYTVVYVYSKQKGDWKELTIYGQRVKSEFTLPDVPQIGDPFPIENDFDMYYPYVPPSIVYAGPGAAMHIAYTANKESEDYFPIYMRKLDGTNVGAATLVFGKKDGARNSAGALASSTPGNSIVAWHHEPLAGKQKILAQRIGTFEMQKTFLPSIFKEK